MALISPFENWIFNNNSFSLLYKQTQEVSVYFEIFYVALYNMHPDQAKLVILV